MSGDDTLTPARKVERIKALLDRCDLTSAQKCVGVKIIAEADKNGIAEVRTPELQRAASARDRETVFRATKALKGADITKASGSGQSGRFSVLPAAVVEAVVEAFDAARTGRVEPDGMPTTGPVGLNRTGPVEPVGFEPTGRVEPDRSRALVPAHIETPSGLVITKEIEDDSEEEEGKVTGNLDALEAFNAWNDLAQRLGLATARSLTPQRRKSILARMREHGGIDAWRIALANIERSAFLRGTNDRGWRADLDFLLQASRFAKVVDGAYGNGAHGGGPVVKEGSTARTMRIARELEEQAGGRS